MLLVTLQHRYALSVGTAQLQNSFFENLQKKCLVEKRFGSAGAGIQCARVTPNQLYPSCVCPYDVTEARRRRKI